MPTVAEALAIAVKYHQANELDAAEQIYRQILAVEPNEIDALHLLGVVASQLGRHEFGIQCIRRAIELNGNESAIHSSLGNIHQNLQQFDEAIGCYRRALELNPDNFEAHNNLGNAFQTAGKVDEAVACYRRALTLRSDSLEVQSNLGVALKNRGNLDEAIACFRRALEWNPNDAESHNNLGSVFIEQRRLSEAIDCFSRALALKPNFPEACSNLGIAFQAQGNLDDAIDCFNRALEQRPNYAEAQYNLGAVFQFQGRFDEAIAKYSHALELNLDHAMAHYSRSLLMLQRGDFQNWWPAYEWRWKTKQLVERKFTQPRWGNSPLAEQTILLHAEQGLGDTLQFVRYATQVKKQNPRAIVILECPRALTKLLATCSGIDRLIAEGDELPPFDVHSPLLSLPGIFKTTVETIPADVPYLFADPTLVAHWRKRLSVFNGLRIGINWQGRPGHGEFRRRDIPLDLIASLAAIPGLQLISLQRGAGQAELNAAAGKLPVIDLGEFDTDHGAFMDTAAIMQNVNLVISSDTAAPHLAGALGVPVWVALPYVADWRWLLERNDSPWYPTVRLFRQKRAGDWAGVFEEIGAALRERVKYAK